MVTPLPPGEAHVPRILPLIAVLGLLTWAHGRAPDVVNAILILILLYVVLDNPDRSESLLTQAEQSLARIVHPSTRPTAGGSVRPRPS